MQRFLISVLFVLLIPPAMHSQEETQAQLTLAEVLRRVKEQHPALHAQRHRERAAEALIEQAGLRPNPTLDVALENFLGTGTTRGVRRLEATVQANQVFERGAKRDKRMALADREHDSAARESAVRRAEIFAAAVNAFVETLAAQQRLALAEEPLRLAQATLAAADERVRTGFGSSAESARARASIAMALTERARAHGAWMAARSALAAHWGGRADEAVALAGTIRVPEELPEPSHFMSALEQHPRVLWQEAIIAASRAALDVEQARAVGDITVGGGVRFLRDGTDTALVAGVSVPLAVRHKNQGNIRAARETLAAAEQTKLTIVNELRGAVAAAWEELQTAHAIALDLRREALPLAEQAHAIVQHAYDAGELPLVDVLDAQRALVAVRHELFNAECSYAIALARVEALTGFTFSATRTLLSVE